MKMISQILIGIGLLTTLGGSLATRYGINTFITALEDSGIGAVARAIDTTSTYNTVSLLGCFILIVGLALSTFSKRQRT